MVRPHLALLVALPALAGCNAILGNQPGEVVPPMPVISRNLPAFSSAQMGYPAKNANDDDYSDQSIWRAPVPSWLAYDLSTVPADARGKVVAFYSNPGNRFYDHVAAGNIDSYNNLGAYTIEAAAGPSGDPPTSGWTVLASVDHNVLASRQQVLDLTGYQWIRWNVTASDGSTQNNDAAGNFDVHDAHRGAYDDWIFFGDDFVVSGLQAEPIGGEGTLAQLVAKALPERFPLLQPAGINGYSVTDGVSKVLGAGGWLALFPGRYVALCYGHWDAHDGMNPPNFASYERKLVEGVLAAGKVPVVPTIPWTPNGGVQTNGPALNDEIKKLYQDYPGIIPGPDLWARFQGHPELFNGDVFLNDAGSRELRAAWLEAMTTRVY